MDRLSSSLLRNTKKLWSSRFICRMASSVKPMSPEEAILQMNLLDHSFFVFRSSEDDSLSIVYRRKNGGYGLIVTDEVE